jgi:hypothetical protein
MKSKKAIPLFLLVTLTISGCNTKKVDNINSTKIESLSQTLIDENKEMAAAFNASMVTPKVNDIKPVESVGEVNEQSNPSSEEQKTVVQEQPKTEIKPVAPKQEAKPVATTPAPESKPTATAQTTTPATSSSPRPAGWVKPAGFDEAQARDGINTGNFEFMDAVTAVEVGKAKMTEASGFTPSEVDTLNKALAENKKVYDYFVANKTYKDITVVNGWGYMPTEVKARQILAKKKVVNDEVKAFAAEMQYAAHIMGSSYVEVYKKLGYNNWTEFRTSKTLEAEFFLMSQSYIQMRYTIYGEMQKGNFYR